MQNQVAAGTKSLDQVFSGYVGYILSPIYQLAVGVALAYFLYGVFMFILNMNKEEARTNGKNHLLYGTIGLFIIFSIGAIFEAMSSYLGGAFGLN